MNIICLCPTYGRHPNLLNNTIQLFKNQDYPAEKRFLLIFDDASTFRNCWGDRWALTTGKSKMDLPAKYNRMVVLADQFFPSWDAVAVWEDDDVYFPNHLSTCAAAMKDHDFHYPTHIYSTYDNGQKEETGGRFHASIAMRKEFLKRIDGWPDTLRADFDQQMIAKLMKNGSRGVVSDEPTFCMRWGDTLHNHASGATRGPQDINWGNRVPIQHPPPPNSKWWIEPKLDESTLKILERWYHSEA